MKTNLPGDLETLAKAAIESEATDAQLEALENAIMDRDDGADVLRDMAEAHAMLETPVPAAASMSGGKIVRRIVIWASATAVAAAAGLVLLAGAVVLYLNGIKNGKSGHPGPGGDASVQIVAAPPSSAELPAANFGNGEFPLEASANESLPNQAVPEPSTALLFFSGLSILMLRRRRS